MDYSNYRTEDFVLDEYFQQWVLYKQRADFWQSFLSEYPHKEAELQQARQIVLGIAQDHQALPPEKVETIRQNIQQRISASKTVVRPLYGRYWSVAASLAGVLLLSFLAVWWYTLPDIITYRTDFGEVESIQLPDGSTVTLNANSELEWYAEMTDRKVNLRGEAFFQVRKDQGRKFIVYANDVEVEVLGTSFNVKNRDTQTEVVLRSGSVALRHTPSGEKTLMQPGDLISVREDKSLIRQRVDTEQFTAYTERQLRIDHTSLTELATIIEDLYGYTVTIESKALSERRFTATTQVPLEEISTLLQLIEATFGAEVVQDEDKIIIRDGR